MSTKVALLEGCYGITIFTSVATKLCPGMREYVYLLDFLADRIHVRDIVSRYSRTITDTNRQAKFIFKYPENKFNQILQPYNKAMFEGTTMCEVVLIFSIYLSIYILCIT